MGDKSPKNNLKKKKKVADKGGAKPAPIAAPAPDKKAGAAPKKGK